MPQNDEKLQKLLGEIEKLNARHELSGNLPELYFEPGMMENLDRFYGSFDEATGTAVIRTEVKGVRYEGRTQRLEYYREGNGVRLIRDPDNIYNSCNFAIVSEAGENLGNLAAELCNAIAPLYDDGRLSFESSFISYMERIGDRSRYARQGILFIEIRMKIDSL